MVATKTCREDLRTEITSKNRKKMRVSISSMNPTTTVSGDVLRFFF